MNLIIKPQYKSERSKEKKKNLNVDQSFGMHINWNYSCQSFFFLWEHITTFQVTHQKPHSITDVTLKHKSIEHLCSFKKQYSLQV